MIAIAPQSNLVVPVRISSMGQIDLSKKLFVLDKTLPKKIKNKQHLKKSTRKCKYDCTMNMIP